MYAYARLVLVVTTNDLPGYEVREVIGQVLGTTARALNPFQDGVKNLQGGVSPRASEHLAHWRQDAVDQLIEAADRRGANAVIGMRFDHRRIGEYWGEICAYGTAVVASRRAVPTDSGEISDDQQRHNMGAGT
jgi:uncharacterized protein YbjQ (UPF0145 family)